MRKFWYIVLITATVALVNPALASPKQFETANTHLTTVYHQLLSRLAASGQEQLRRSQKQWLLFRVSECSYRQAAFAIMTSEADCKTALTQARINDLGVQSQWLVEMAGQ